MKLHRFKQAALAIFASAAIAASAHSQAITGFGDLNYWGTGANHSALVISWNDGKTESTIAWGFSWDGASTVGSMLTALAAADPHLFVRLDSVTDFGPAIFGLGYDANGNGVFSVTGAEDTTGAPAALVFTSGVSDTNTGAGVQAPLSSETAAPGESADHYGEGWFDHGFWEFFTGGNSASYPTVWTSDFTGASTTLVDNGWYAFSLAGEYDPDLGSSPSFPPGAAIAAVPEPATLVLLAIGGAVLFWRRKARA